jgi:hypothetical protein
MIQKKPGDESDDMSKLYFSIPADPCLHSLSYCPSHANSLQLPRPTADARLYHIGQPEALYAESAVDGSRTPRPSVAQQSPNKVRYTVEVRDRSYIYIVKKYAPSVV